MRRHGRWQRLARWTVAAGLLSGPGCLCLAHPIAAPPPCVAEPCRLLPKCARDHVYVFFVHGMDPLDCANLEGLRDYVQGLGFVKTYYGQLYHAGYFHKEIRRLHAEDPDARFVLVGFSFGANAVRDLARSMQDEGIRVDLLVYLGGNTLHNTPEDQPAGAGRLINVLAQGSVWNGDTLDRAENIRVPDVWHFGSPSHPATLLALARGLVEVAATVPVVVPAEAPEPETAPMPHPVTEPPPAHGPEWDFLKPVARLGGQVEAGTSRAP
jgi:hypothetical protein